jgi:hypothetical protein
MNLTKNLLLPKQADFYHRKVNYKDPDPTLNIEEILIISCVCQLYVKQH